MNKELAINLLRGSVLGTNEQLHEAVFMAIKALKAEPKYGQWIFTEYESGDAEYCCSECGEGVYDRPNYCPNCGADMREVEE